VERAYRNLGFVLLALPLIFIMGFWIPYISQIPHLDPAITPAVHVHALLLFAWVALLVAQPLAIRSSAFTVHRLLGKASYVLMPLILLFAIGMVHKEYLQHLANGTNAVTARTAEYLSSCQLVMLAGFYVLAVSRIQKGNTADHMRYMICIALVLLPAGLARTLGYWFNVSQTLSQTVCLAVIDLCLVALIIFDKRWRISAQPYTIALAAYLTVEAGWVALGRPV